MAAIDPSQLSGWFSEHGAALVLYARQWLDQASAEDVVQEVFLRLMAQRRSPASVKAWLFCSVRNAAISRIRSSRSRRTWEQRAHAERGTWFEHRSDDLIDAATAQDVLSSLPDEQREVVVLRIWGELALREISDITGQPVSTLFSRYQAGLAEIRRRMESSCTSKNR